MSCNDIECKCGQRKIKRLKAEQNKLKEELKIGNSLYAKLTDRINDKEAERDHLKAELSERNKLEDCLKINEDRNLWKSKAEKLVEALSKIAHFDGGMPGKVREYAEEALEEYEKGNESL